MSVDLDPETESRVKLAGFIAESFSSRLIGVAAEEIDLPLYFEYPAGIEPTTAELEKGQAAQDLVHAANRFQHAAWMCKSLEWHSAFGIEPGFIANFRSRHARAADLIVVSQRTSGDAMARKMIVDPGSLVLMAGRPVLTGERFSGRRAHRNCVEGWPGGQARRVR